MPMVLNSEEHFSRIILPVKLKHMKTSLHFKLAMAVLGAGAVSIMAQTQTNETTSTSSGYVQTTKIVGITVKSGQGEQVGVVKDVILDRNTGCIAYTVLSTGGTGGTAKMVAVPWTVYSSTEPGGFVVSVDRERIYNAPVFEYSRINEYSTTGYIDNVDSYFGVSAGVGRSQTTTGATTDSRAGRQTGAYASPAQTTSPSMAASPSRARSASERATPSASAAETAAAEESPRESASPKGRRGKAREETTPGRTRASVTPGEQRHRTETGRERTEQSPPETTESPSAERKQGAHEPSTRETTEPSATPEQR
jgi:sporulation protein YlmC with PRC-barrel domain